MAEGVPVLRRGARICVADRVTWSAAGALLRRFWWVLPIAALAMALVLTRETLADRTLTLTNERAAWNERLRTAEAAKAAAERRYAMQIAQAATAYADRIAAREPIIVRSTNTVREYAQTDAGRAVCLGADRVRGIDDLDAALFAPDPAGAGGGTGAVPADAR